MTLEILICYIIPLAICLLFSIINRKEEEVKTFFLISLMPFGNVFLAVFIIIFGLMFLIDDLIG